MTTISGLRLQAITVNLIDEMANRGGWCGETHIQKSFFFLKTITGDTLGYDFIMYKHGPYSFELHDDLIKMKAIGAIRTDPQFPYGPSFRIEEAGKNLMKRFPRSLRQFHKGIVFVAEEFSDKTVKDLERLATALFVTAECSNDCSPEDRARSINNLKPHITFNLAKEAATEVDNFLAKSRKEV